MIIYTATNEEWERIRLQDEFYSDGFEKEGFIHCSFPKQTVWVLNKHYKKEEKMILLCIDPTLLGSKLRVEDLKGRGETFPHVYGSIKTKAIVKIVHINRSTDGSFYENEELKSL